jgi:gliding motility-associated lipoprotein GldH
MMHISFKFFFQSLFSNVLFSCILLCTACDSNRIHEQYIDLPNSEWKQDQVLSFSFEIDDTDIYYDLFYNLRYGAEYPYYNLYVQYTLLDPSGKELPWVLKDSNLMHPTTGVPLGKGLVDLFDIQFRTFANYRFPAKGKYTFKIRQYMRLSTLRNIQAVGLRVEKVE